MEARAASKNTLIVTDNDHMNRRLIIFFLLIVSLLFSGCSTSRVITARHEPLISAYSEIPEEQLLDIGIVIFDPGLDREYSEDEMIMPGVRKAEARFIPVHLKHTLQQSGQWGAVRVIPSELETADVVINGKILESDGEVLSLKVTAMDSTGRVWLDNIYQGEKNSSMVYGNIIRGKNDAFQSVYNAIANDLMRELRQQSGKQIQNIQRVSTLRFSKSIMPYAFSGYIGRDKNQQLQAVRFPADDDQMFARIQKIKGRDEMLIDTIDSYYDQFYTEMWESYGAWRANHLEEVVAYREMKASALNRYLLGAASIAGAVALAMAGVDGTSLLQGAMIAGGGYAIKTGFDKSEEAQINADAIKELDQSFDAEVKPQIIEVDGQTLELTGSARVQYQTWRKMLRELYMMETGFEPGRIPPSPSIDVLVQ